MRLDKTFLIYGAAADVVFTIGKMAFPPGRLAIDWKTSANCISLLAVSHALTGLAFVH
jgi:hypothetical protein